MIRKRRIHKPFDFGYAILYVDYPKELHNQLNVPGIFKRKANTKVKLANGVTGEMDTSYIVDPDFKTIFEPMLVNGEHQSIPVSDGKLNMMGYYAIQQIHDENLGQFSFIASHIPKKKHVQSLKLSLSHTIEPIFIDLGEEDNKKKLSTVKNIIKQQDTISDEDALNLGIIVLFAPRHIAQEVTGEVVELYGEISEQLSLKMIPTLYTVICTMIDAYFDEEKEYERMMNMMKENTDAKTVEKFESLELIPIRNDNIIGAIEDLVRKDIMICFFN